MKRWLFLVALSVLILRGVDAQAGVVKPTADKKDALAINKELRTTGYVKLLQGKTYYLSYPVWLNSNQTIDATGATLVVKKSAVRNDPKNYKKDYSSMYNIVIRGGRWVSNKKKGNKGTSFSLAHCRRIILEGLDIQTTNAEGHGIELVGCQDVSIKKCNVVAQGKGKAKSVEEMIQIDLAAPHTAPFLSSKYRNGLPCNNIMIDGCVVKGNRGICANYAKKDKKYRNKCHSKITITNSVITGLKSEALALFNAANVTVQNNTIITNSKRTGEAYSIGCHMAVFGKNSILPTSVNTVMNNTIMGGRQGFQLCSHSKSQYGSLTISNNKIYCKKGKKNALVITNNTGGKSSAGTVIESGNERYKW